jgi:succinate dehydrogenase / fumarate reductase membrane anchor subunit
MGINFNVMSLTQNGLRDWIIQRVTAVILALYVIVLLGFFIKHPGLNFETWRALFACSFMKTFSFLALLSLVFHSWVGVWTILTDYIKSFILRFILETLLVLALLSFLAWGIKILWGF